MKLTCKCGNDKGFKVKIVKDYNSDYPVGWGIEGFEITCSECGDYIEVNSDGIHTLER